MLVKPPQRHRRAVPPQSNFGASVTQQIMKPVCQHAPHEGEVHAQRPVHAGAGQADEDAIRH